MILALVEKDIILNGNLSEYGIAVLATIRCIAGYGLEEDLISTRSLGYWLYGYKAAAYDKKLIQKGLNELIDSKIVELKLFGRGEYICSFKKILRIEEGCSYYGVYEDEIKQIFRANTSLNKYKILKYYFVTVGSFDGRKSIDERYRFKVGTMSHEFICGNSLVSKASAIKYRQFLEDEKLLYVIKHEDYFIKENADGYVPLRVSNTYSRYEDRLLCDEYDKTYKKNFKKKNDDKDKKTNKMRSRIQKYNALLKGKEYDQKTMKEIYDSVVEWNESKKLWYEDQIEQGYCPPVPKYKDLSVFEKYGISKSKE